MIGTRTRSGQSSAKDRCALRARSSVTRWTRAALAKAAQQATVEGEPLLGADRAQEIVLNVVLPFAMLQSVLAAQALALAASLPASAAYGKTRFLEANFAPANGKRAVKGALAQQGLLSLLNEWCSQGGCGRCPLSPGQTA